MAWLPRMRRPLLAQRPWWSPGGAPGAFKADLIAGLTGAILVVPQGIAYALLAGLPPQYGLYTAVIPTLLAALFGDSRQMVSGPTAALSIALFATLAPLAEAGSEAFIALALTLTLLTGLFQLLLGVARLGGLVALVSHSVVVGFTAGAALIIAASQLPAALGLTRDQAEVLLDGGVDLLAGLGAIRPGAALIAVVTLGLCLACRRWRPRWPAMPLALLLATLLAQAIDPGGEQIPRIAAVPAGLPPLVLPQLSLESFSLLAPGAIALGLLGLVEAAAISRALASRSGQRIDANREFIGQGLSNLGGAFFSAYVSSGSFTRSGLNASAGARTSRAAMLAALLLVPMLLLATPWLRFIPTAAIAGLLLLVAINLIDRRAIAEALRAGKNELSVLLITFVGTLLLALEVAILLGVLTSLALYLRRTTRPPVVPAALHQAPAALHEPLDEATCDVVRIDGSLYFGACDSVARRLDAFERPNLVILAAGINFIDLSGIHLLERQARRCRERGGRLYLAWAKPDVMARLRQAGLVDDVQHPDTPMAITI